MKKSSGVKATQLAVGLTCWLIVTNIFVVLARFTGWLPFQVLVFIGLVFLPGFTLLRCLRIVLRTFSAGILYSFGLSVLVLMLSGLALNEILPLFHMIRPLQLPYILCAWDAVCVGLIGLSLRCNRVPIRFNMGTRERFSRPAWLLLGMSVLPPAFAVMGAFRLNNGGNGLFAEIALCITAVLIAYMFICRSKLPDGLLAWCIFDIGLTILFMTSLRGWDIVGHDIEREFRVYTLTHEHARWNIGLNRDPYNACLSITILPEMFAKLLSVSGLMVFKVVSQVIFAACPVVIFVLLRQYLSKLAALCGALLFICYPTFINDSAMLTRQGIAYLFFSLALLVISNRAQKVRYKLLFSGCALGAVLSHYSTAYMFAALFTIAVVCKVCVMWIQRRQRQPFRHWLSRQERLPHTVLSLVFAVLLVGMTFVWYTQVTATSRGLVTTLGQSLASVPKIFSADNKSSDTSTALLFAGGKSEADLYQSYLSSSIRPQLSVSALPNAANYFPVLTSDAMPLTSMGKKALAVGLNPSLVEMLRQNFAKLLQVLALAGVAYTCWRLLRRRPDALGVDFICLSLAGFMVLVMMVVLPVLSENYGVLRAFQQILIFLLLPIMLLLTRLGGWLRPWIRTAVATISIVALFFLFTGFFAQILGGTGATLSLDNSGIYYGLYYSSRADIQSFAWMKQHIPVASDVRAANFNRAIMHDPSYPFTKPGILPSQLGTDTYIYLDPAQVTQQKLYTYYQSSPLIMQLPIDYYGAAKNEIYSTTTTGVYR